jgi:release factor glutamine methyltransferase
MDDKKRGLDDLLSDLGIGENESAPEVVLEEERAPIVAQPNQAQDPKSVLEHFMVGLLLRLDPAYAVDIVQEGGLFRVEILGGDSGRVIGREGKTLQSLEFIVNVVMAKHFGPAYRVVLDAAGYRRRNEERLRRIAADAALQVEASGQPIELPPMRPSERRLIHLMLKQHPKVTTTSVGEGEERHVVVLPREARAPENDPRPKRFLELVQALQQELRAAGKPVVESRWLVAHAARLSDQELALRLAEFVPPDVEEAARAMLNLRLSGYPLQLLLGEAEFFGLKLRVERGVLIPRPETEGLVEHAVAYLPPDQPARVLDVGTGCGAIALAIKAMRPQATVWASDINPKALELARRNALQLGLEVTFLEAPFTANLQGLDLIVSNPPYLPESYRQEAPPELAYEDPNALYAGPDGLGVARELLPQAWKALKPGGRLWLELAPENVYTLLAEATAQGWLEAQVLPDLALQPRYLSLRKPAEP